MTREGLIQLLEKRYQERFAEQAAEIVTTGKATGVLYELVTSPMDGYPAALRHRLLFRGAYLLERIYFDQPELFMPYATDFCRRDFAACTDGSARRHFGKIMAHLMTHHKPAAADWTGIATAAADWIVDERSKVAVRVWAVEVLKHCKEHVEWVAPIWEDLMAMLAADASPAIRNRMCRRWKKRSDTE